MGIRSRGRCALRFWRAAPRILSWVQLGRLGRPSGLRLAARPSLPAKWRNEMRPSESYPLNLAVTLGRSVNGKSMVRTLAEKLADSEQQRTELASERNQLALDLGQARAAIARGA